MKNYKLDKEEKKIQRAIEAGEYAIVKNQKKEIVKFQEAAKFTLNRNRHINVRVSERDLMKIKARAFERGIPYQTLVTSILHQFSNNKIKELAR